MNKAKITVAVRDRDSLEDLVKLACSTADRMGAEITALRVVEVLPGVRLDANLDELDRPATELLSRASELACKDCSSEISTRLVRAYSASHAIVTEVKAQAADLLILGYDRKHALEKMLFGSTAARVVRNAPCRVLSSGPAHGLRISAIRRSVRGQTPTAVKSTGLEHGVTDMANQSGAYDPTAASTKDQGETVAKLQEPAFLFDLDGTLVDSVYQHVLAWREALEQAGIELSVWRIHRRIGMSGGLFVNALLRETGHHFTAEEAIRLQRLHEEAYVRQVKQVRSLPGARELLACLTQLGVPWAIATSGRRETAAPALELLGLGSDIPVITRDQVSRAKPDPDLFLAAAERLKVRMSTSVVVGDSVWDLLAARRAGAPGVGLLSGGYGRDELERAGAYRVYEDPADLLRHLDEVGVRGAE